MFNSGINLIENWKKNSWPKDWLFKKKLEDTEKSCEHHKIEYSKLKSRLDENETEILKLGYFFYRLSNV